MHILIIPSSHFLTPCYPLGGIFQFHQANALHDAGYQVGVIAAGVITTRFLLKRYEYPGFEIKNGYPVLRRYVRKLHPQRWVRPHRGISFYQKLGLELYMSYKKKFGVPDVIHAHNVYFAGFIAQVIREKFGVPYIITEHDGKFMMENIASGLVGPMRMSIQHASAMTAVSRALADAIKKQIGVCDIDVLPNIVDSVIIGSPFRNRYDSDSNFVFLNIASMDANKDQSSLIEAFSSHFKGKQASLRIGGTGPLGGHLKKLAQRLGVENQVAFLGYLDRPSVMLEMQAADCFVLPSLYESFGVVLIESLACGTPVISTFCGGAEDIVNEKNGLLVATRDPAALGSAMVQMAQANSRYQADVLREECRTRFGKEAFVANVRRFYAKAMELH